MKSALLKLIFVTIVLHTITGCNSKKTKDDNIKIGVILPYTGELATYGNDSKRGIDIAVNEINMAGGIQGKKIEILSGDSKGESKTAVTIMLKNITIDNTKLFIGDISSTVTLSLIPIIEQNKVFLFSPCAATPKLTNISRYFARNWPSNNAEANSAADFVSKKYNKSKDVIIVYVNNDWGLGLMENFEKRYIDLGGAIKAKLIYNYGEEEFRTLIIKLNTLDPSVIYLAGNQKEMGYFMRQLREINKIIPVVANTSFLEPDCLNIAGKSSEGTIVSTPEYNPFDSTSIKIISFTNTYSKKYNSIPSLTAANSYDAIFLIKQAIEKEGFDVSKIAGFIRDYKEFSGASGRMNFTNGDVEINVVYKIILGGIPQKIE